MWLLYVLISIFLSSCIPDINQAKQELMDRIGECDARIDAKFDTLCAYQQQNPALLIVCPSGPTLVCMPLEDGATLACSVSWPVVL
jgi:hypothetical protein